MTDITKCTGDNCPHKEGCYRFEAKASLYQSFFVTPPIEDGKCDMYWGDNSEVIFNQLKEIAKLEDNGK